MLALLRSTHPGPTVAVTAFSLLLALRGDRDAGWGAGWGAEIAVTVLAVLAGQLSVGWSNDWIDRDRDRQIGRREKPLVNGSVSDRAVLSAAMAALAACVVLSLATGLVPGSVHLLAVASAWSYNLGLKSTLASPLPYLLSFALLVGFIGLAGGSGWPAPEMLAAAALLGGGAHFTNTLADLDADAATGVRGLPHRLGERVSLLLAAVLLAGATVLVALAANEGRSAVTVAALLAAGLAIAGVVGAGVAGRGRVAFRFTMAAAGSLVLAFASVGAGA